jgi:hypothetical protein
MQEIDAFRLRYPNTTELLEVKEFEKGHEMINSKLEMQAVMKLLDSRFRLRNLGLERDPDVRTAWEEA